MQRETDVLVIGLEHVLPKVGNWYGALAEEGISSVIYSMDQSGLSKKTVTHHDVRVLLVPEQLGIVSRWLVGLPMLLWLYFSLKPKHVEVYDPEICGRFWLACISILGILRARIVIVDRGGAFGYHELGEAQQNWLKWLYRIARLIVYKEMYMKQLFVREYGLVDDEKLLFVHNRVRVDPREPSLARPEPRVVLYLNNYRRWKRPDLCIHAAAIVRRTFPDVEFWIVGSMPVSSPGAENRRQGVWDYYSDSELLALADELGVREQVKLFQFADDPGSYYDRCSVFLFPSDLVFCNFSLLEAMERAVPAVISDVPDSERIVNDGVDGFRVPQTADAMAEKIIMLLRDEQCRERIGLAARRKVIDKYNAEDLPSVLLKAYRKRVWELE